jgi:hypothetical protein
MYSWRTGPVPGDITHAFVLHGTIEVEARAELNVTREGRVLTRPMAAVFNGTRGGWRESDPPDL